MGLTYEQLKALGASEIPATNSSPQGGLTYEQLTALGASESPVPTPTPEKSLLEKIKNFSTSPLISPEAFTGMSKEQMAYEAQPYQGESSSHAAARVGALGAVGTTGRIMSGYSSPAALAMLAASGGTAPAIKAVQGLAGMVFGAQGLKEAITPQQPGELPADALERRLLGASQAASGAAGALDAGTQLKAIGVQKMDARARAAQVKASAAADEAFTKAIPPSKSAPYSEQDYQAAKPYLAAEHANQPIETVPDLIDAADSAIGKIDNQVKGYVSQFPDDVIKTDPISDVKAKLYSNMRSDAMAKGLKQLEPFDLDQPITNARAELIRQQLNAENKAVLKRNNYDVATARSVDPGFAAREIAAKDLRDGLYDNLQARGIPDARQLRFDEGSLIKIRNAALSKEYMGERGVAGTKPPTFLRKTAAELGKAATVGAGAAIGGVPGAIIGRGAGDVIFSPLTALQNATRNALIKKAFGGNP